MKTKLIALFLSITLVLVLSACGGAAAPAATAAPAGGDAAATPADGGAAPAAGSGSAVFNNTGSIDLCELYLSPVSKEEWGQNQLKDGAKIAVGDKYTLTGVPVGQYDAKAVGCDGTSEAVIQLEVK